MVLAVVWDGISSIKDTSHRLRRQARVTLDIKTPKRCLAVHLQLYPVEKEQLATASTLFGNYNFTQSAMPIPIM